MEMSSEKSETMALLGQDPVRCNSLWTTMFTTNKEFYTSRLLNFL